MTDQSPLERRYRRWLALYPKSFRAEREDEMVAVLMEGADPDQTHPRPGEAANLAAHGLRRRVREQLLRSEILAYWSFVVIGFAQLGALVLIGDSTVSSKGLIPIGVMVAWLGRRSRTAWWIFLLVNVCEVIATLALVLGSVAGASSGSGTLWGDVVAILLGSSTLVAILLSRPMRTWTRPRDRLTD